MCMVARILRIPAFTLSTAVIQPRPGSRRSWPRGGRMGTAWRPSKPPGVRQFRQSEDGARLEAVAVARQIDGVDGAQGAQFLRRRHPPAHASARRQCPSTRVSTAVPRFASPTPPAHCQRGRSPRGAFLHAMSATASPSPAPPPSSHASHMPRPCQSARRSRERETRPRRFLPARRLERLSGNRYRVKW